MNLESFYPSNSSYTPPPPPLNWLGPGGLTVEPSKRTDIQLLLKGFHPLRG